MLRTFVAIPTLLLGIAILLVGNGFLGTLLGVRAAQAGMSAAVIGLVMSAYFVGFIIGSFLCPDLIRRVGHIRAFAAMAAAVSTVAVFHGLVLHALVWALLRVIAGICLVGIYMVVESWLNTLAPGHRRGRFIAAYMTITLVALGFGQFLILIDAANPLLPFALISVLSALALVPIALTRLDEPRPVMVPPLGLADLYKVSPLGVVGAAVAGLCSGAFWGVGAVFAQGIGLPEAGIAAFMGATVFGGVLLQWPVGHFSDRHDRRQVLTAVSFVGAALALAAFFAAGWSITALAVCAFLYGGIAFSLYGLAVAHVNDHLRREEVLDATRGLLLVNGLGAVFGPAGGGLLMSAFGPRSLLALFAFALLALGTYGLVRIGRRPPVPLSEQTAFVPLTRTSQVVLEMLSEPERPLQPDLRTTS